VAEQQRPLWRQVYDAAEGAVTPHLEALVRTPEFARFAALAARAQARAREQATGATSRVWHLLNLPAGTDVARLRAQIGALDREVRRLTLRLEQERSRNPDRGDHQSRDDHRSDDNERREDAGDAPTEPDRGAQPRAPRRRAKRPPGP
jgi:hypothetical protein